MLSLRVAGVVARPHSASRGLAIFEEEDSSRALDLLHHCELRMRVFPLVLAFSAS